MKNLKIISIVCFCIFQLSITAQNNPPKDIQVQTTFLDDTTLMLPQKDLQWWKNAKFGMFIHWGLYSILGKGEWAMFLEKINMDEYSDLKNEFAAQNFNAKNWADVAKSAGCKYMVFTAKHHDGFCMFNSSYDNFNSMHTPAKRDFVKEYVEACRGAGLGAGIYYSPLDWRFPGFFFPEMYRESAEQMKKKTYSNMHDLMTKYGKIDILWYDGGQDMWLGHGGLEFSADKGWYTRDRAVPYTGSFSWEPLKLNKMVREVQPKIVINSRSGWIGDYGTQERNIHSQGTDARPWELCTTLTYGAWGWTPDAKVMELNKCLRLLSEVVCKGGNLLLNVGPDKNGNIDSSSISRLNEIGKWLDVHGESIYNTVSGPFAYNESWGGSTQNGDFVYLHIRELSEIQQFKLQINDIKISSVSDLTTGKKLDFENKNGFLLIKDLKIPDNYGVKVLKLKINKK